MALDFSKFLLPAPSTEWLSKVPEYNAMGAKVAEASKSKKDFYGSLNRVGDVSKVIPTGAEHILSNAMITEINDGWRR